MHKPTIVLINGSLHGDSEKSNTLTLLRMAEKELSRRGAKTILISPELVTYQLNGLKAADSIYVLNVEKTLAALGKADGAIFGTGTHWGQSSSTLQKFIEDATPSEGTKIWLGKPVGIIVSEHSTGGQSVASTLVATLSNYGAFIVPQGWMVFSRAGQEAKRHGDDWKEDVWGPDDIKSICDSLMIYARSRKKLKSWQVDDDPESFHDQWVKPKRQKKNKAPVRSPR